jgi:prepilin-type N-terminal cleavage/methylation domain-containing protein
MYIKDKKHTHTGFTLIEILIVIGLIAVLATIVLVAINPARQFAQARNSQRISNVNTILNAISQNIADHKGTFTCEGITSLPSTATVIAATAGINLRTCLVPTYVTEIPIDPEKGNFTSSSDYTTGYTVTQDTTTKRITVEATHAELDEKISVTR